MRKHFNPLRAARGAAQTFSAPNHGAAALFNNSTGAHILRVWQAAGSGSVGVFFGTYYLRGRLTNHDQGTIAPLYTDQGVPPGTIDTDNLAVMPLVDFWPVIIVEPAMGLGSPYPFALLRPGWSLVVVDSNSNQNYSLSFLWDYVYPEDLYSPSAGDSDYLP